MLKDFQVFIFVCVYFSTCTGCRPGVHFQQDFSNSPYIKLRDSLQRPYECPKLAVGKGLLDHERFVIRTLHTENVFHCCEACQQHCQCQSWTRNRKSGLCQLVARCKARNTTDSQDYDSGGALGTNVPSRNLGVRMEEVQGCKEKPVVLCMDVQIPSSKQSTNTSLNVNPSPGSNEGSLGSNRSMNESTVVNCTTVFTAVCKVVPVRRLSPTACRVSEGVTYRGGSVILHSKVRNANICCNVCRSSKNCRSWYYHLTKQLCILNRNVPHLQTLAGYKGGRV